MCKKYSNYLIRIKFLNNDEETIKYEDERDSSYKDMLELYNETKTKYKDYTATIEFLGVSNNGKMEIMWSKENITKDKELKEMAELYCTKETEKVLNNAIEALKAIHIHRAYIRGEVESLSKDRSLKLHSIEKNKSNKEYSIEEKIAFFDSVKEISDDRRGYKDNISMLDILFEKFNKHNINLKFIESLINETIQEKEIKKEKFVELTEEKAEELKIVKKVKFRNYDEKITLMMKLQKQFSKVIAKDNEMMLYCYKRCYDTCDRYNSNNKNNGRKKGYR